MALYFQRGVFCHTNNQMATTTNFLNKEIIFGDQIKIRVFAVWNNNFFYPFLCISSYKKRKQKTNTWENKIQLFEENLTNNESNKGRFKYKHDLDYIRV